MNAIKVTCPFCGKPFNCEPGIANGPDAVYCSDECEQDATENERRRDERIANRIDGYDRDDLGESPDW